MFRRVIVAGCVCAVVACHKVGTEAPSAAGTTAADRLSSAPSHFVKPRLAENTPLWVQPGRVVASPDSAAAVSVPASARVLRVFVAPGDRVSRGDLVARILSPGLVQARARASSSAGQVELLNARVERLRSLMAEGMVREPDLVEAQVRAAEAQAVLSEARAVLESAGIDPQGRGMARDGTWALRSPIDGIVSEVDAVAGQWLEVSAAPLARIVGPGASRIEVAVPAPVDAVTRVSFDVPGSLSRPLRFTSAIPQSPGTGWTAWFDVVGGAALAAGSSGLVRATLQPEPGTVVVPPSSVVNTGTAASVLVRGATGAEGSLSIRPVPVRVVASTPTDLFVVRTDGQAWAPQDEVATEPFRLAPPAEGGGE